MYDLWPIWHFCNKLSYMEFLLARDMHTAIFFFFILQSSVDYLNSANWKVMFFYINKVLL